MEPGHEDREYATKPVADSTCVQPQWSPVMKTGNTDLLLSADGVHPTPQWSPVMKTGNTGTPHYRVGEDRCLNGARS